MQIKRNSFSQGEIALTNELSKVTKIKSILAMVTDSEKTTYGDRKGMTTYITRKFEASENQILEPAWSNGFFAFNDVASLSVLIVIPKQYIANLMINIYSDSEQGNKVFN
jgi:hypothetical protein